MMRPGKYFLILFFLLSPILVFAQETTGMPEGETTPPRLLVLDLDSMGADDTVISLLSEQVVSAARDTERWDVLSVTDIRSLLGIEVERRLLGCVDALCAVEVAEAVMAPLSISGSVHAVNRRINVRLSLLDTEAARAINSVSFSSRSVDELLELVRRGVFEMAEVAYRAPSRQEIAWAQSELGFVFGVGYPLEGFSQPFSLGLEYQHRFGNLSIGPCFSYSHASTLVAWDDYIARYDELVRISSMRVGVLGAWPSTGGKLVRAYLTGSIGVTMTDASSSTKQNIPSWVLGTQEFDVGLFAAPGMGLRLFPRATVDFSVEARWVLVAYGLQLHDRARPLAGESPPSLNPRSAALGGLCLVGVISYGF